MATLIHDECEAKKVKVNVSFLAPGMRADERAICCS